MLCSAHELQKVRTRLPNKGFEEKVCPAWASCTCASECSTHPGICTTFRCTHCGAKGGQTYHEAYGLMIKYGHACSWNAHLVNLPTQMLAGRLCHLKAILVSGLQAKANGWSLAVGHACGWGPQSYRASSAAPRRRRHRPTDRAPPTASAAGCARSVQALASPPHVPPLRLLCAPSQPCIWHLQRGTGMILSRPVQHGSLGYTCSSAPLRLTSCDHTYSCSSRLGKLCACLMPNCLC